MDSQPDFYRALLASLGVEYALCDRERRVLEYSSGLPALFTASPGLSPSGWRLEDCFDEFRGAEETLARVARRELPSFRIAHVYREREGQPHYLTLKVFPWPPGLLLAVTDTTEEALLLQRLTQERNEVALLQRHLQEANQHLNILLHRFASPSVAQQLLAQHDLPRPGGEKRTVTVLFVDMRGFTETAEQMAPEAVMDLLNRHFDLFSRTVIQYEGTISHYAGDMMMVLFNAPHDQPDHALRAVQAGLEIRRSVRERSLAEGCPYGLGINTGPAMAGYLGFEERFVYTVVGDAVNVAARLSSAAMPGQILIGPQTYQMVRDHIRANPIGPLRLKGKRTPVLTYEVVGVNETSLKENIPPVRLPGGTRVGSAF